MRLLFAAQVQTGYEVQVQVIRRAELRGIRSPCRSDIDRRELIRRPPGSPAFCHPALSAVSRAASAKRRCVPSADPRDPPV